MPLGKNPPQGNLAFLECRLALQKCHIGPMAPNALSCSGAVWTPLLGFLTGPCIQTRFHPAYDFSSLFFFFWIIQDI